MTGLVSVSGDSLPSADIRQYIENALSQNTRRAYRTDLEHFRGWGGTIPASPEMVAAYLTAHATVLSIATLQRRLVSIAKAHTMQGYADPVKSDLVKLAMRGIRRVHGKPQAQVSAVLKEDLTVMLSHVPDTVKGKRDKALLLLGFCGALRRSELVAVRVEDMEFTAQGIILTLPRSKTDQTGQGRKIGIPKGRGRICPVQAVSDWLTHLRAENGTVFRSITKGGIISEVPLSDRAVADIIKHYAECAGLNASDTLVTASELASPPAPRSMEFQAGRFAPRPAIRAMRCWRGTSGTGTFSRETRRRCFDLAIRLGVFCCPCDMLFIDAFCL